MRRIAGPGHVGNRFVNYDPPGTPTGTYWMAEFGDDLQDELRGVEDEFNIAEAAGTNKYVLAAIKGLAIAHGKPLGELFFMSKYKAPAAFNKDSPDTYFPAVCLDAGDQDLAAANWPDLVPDLRGLRATYNEGIAGEKYAFDVTNWAIATNVATLTFADTTAEKAVLSVLGEDNLVHGDYASWRSITLPDAIGDIDAGEYAITDVDPTARTVSFAFTHANGSDSGAFVVSFYQHRIPGSSTTARVFERPGGVMVAANDADGEGIAGMRRRDRFQGHGVVVKNGSNVGLYRLGGSVTSGANDRQGNEVADYGDSEQYHGREFVDDGVNGTPRIGKSTDPRALVGHAYLWGRKYVA